jgi:putative iron-only hydrogenase system regulator
METRLAIIAIIIEHKDSVSQVNELLHSCAPFIIGRMGIQYPKKSVSIITLIIDAPQDIISTLSGKLGQIKNVSIKTTYSKV